MTDINISGQVIVFDRDKSGHAIQVAVETDDFLKFIIHNDDTGRNLIDLIGRSVKVWGNIVSQNNYFDCPVVIINRYELVG